jgi:hypothetical protein
MTLLRARSLATSNPGHRRRGRPYRRRALGRQLSSSCAVICPSTARALRLPVARQEAGDDGVWHQRRQEGRADERSGKSRISSSSGAVLLELLLERPKAAPSPERLRDERQRAAHCRVALLVRGADPLCQSGAGRTRARCAVAEFASRRATATSVSSGLLPSSANQHRPSATRSKARR